MFYNTIIISHLMKEMQVEFFSSTHLCTFYSRLRIENGLKATFMLQCDTNAECAGVVGIFALVGVTNAAI